MATTDSSENSGRGFPFSIPTLLALLTLGGGLLVTVHRLASDRPVVPAGHHNQELSEQRIDTRLWEDPFAALANPSGSNVIELGRLREEIGQSTNRSIRVLAVMIPGGPASEDREARIRSRYALVSALAQSSFVPFNVEHIGIGRMPWPSAMQFPEDLNPVKPGEKAARAATQKSPKAIHVATQAAGSITMQAVAQSAEDAAPPEGTTPRYLYYSFEWYSSEPWVSHLGAAPDLNKVLLLWLDEDAFAQRPQARLALFFGSLFTNVASHLPDGSGTNANQGETNQPNIKLIGPWRSSTLRLMCQEQFKTNQPRFPVISSAEELESRLPPYTLSPNRVSSVLRHVSLFLATPRVIDEALVKDAPYEPLPTNVSSDNGFELLLKPRLEKTFTNVFNYRLTDADLAHEAIKELHQRGVDLTQTNKHHLVLVTGWDDFFGQMFAATYAAELSREQNKVSSRAEFFRNYTKQNSLWPTNLHPFFYLSGLDGQSLAASSGDSASGQDRRLSETKNQRSQADRNWWTPDVNRAEGPAQLDYLGRLAARIDEVNRQVAKEGHGSVSAVGIGGGDVYDTLLILQALRPRFPNAVFFTTDLDARFWDPKEWEWSRNLVVVSGYGLELCPRLQGPVPPFRCSLQTTLFAAALAALGNTNVLMSASNLPAARFEIGRNGPVDLSDPTSGESPMLQPDSQKPVGLRNWLKEGEHGWSLLALLSGGALLALLLSKYVQQFTWSRCQFLARPLWLKEEDVGGDEGFKKLRAALGAKDGARTAEEIRLWNIIGEAKKEEPKQK